MSLDRSEVSRREELARWQRSGHVTCSPTTCLRLSGGDGRAGRRHRQARRGRLPERGAAARSSGRAGSAARSARPPAASGGWRGYAPDRPRGQRAPLLDRRGGRRLPGRRRLGALDPGRGRTRCAVCGRSRRRRAATCGSPTPVALRARRVRRLPVPRRGRAVHRDAFLGLDRRARGARAGPRVRAAVRDRVRGARRPMYARVPDRAGPAAGTPGDVFTTSALTWGHSILASVQYSDARRAFNDAITRVRRGGHRRALAAPGGPVVRVSSRAGQARPHGRWPVAEAGARLDAMKAKIAEITHPWQLVQEPTPDLGGQHLISLYAMRHESHRRRRQRARAGRAPDRHRGPRPPPGLAAPT